MSYLRVIPRDLFNEASLLKCYGQLYLNLENIRLESCLEHEGDDFEIVQRREDGSLTILNVSLFVREDKIPLGRPLNARTAYPLWACTEEDDIAVFNEDGTFTSEMISLLRGPS